jgi:hypothetical protein
MEICHGFVYGVDDEQLDKPTSMFQLHCPKSLKLKNSTKKINKAFSVKNLTNCNPFNSWQ